MAQINKATDYFNTITWTGDDTTPTRTITGVGFQPDLVWAKRRSNSGSNYIWDVARGTNLNIFSNHTLAELNINTGDPNGGVSTSSSDGFTIIEGTSDIIALNSGGETHVAWNWLGGGTPVSNTEGSVTASVSANTASGFSIIKFTNAASGNLTVGHGLNFAPEIQFWKTTGGVQSWFVLHKDLTSYTDRYLRLQGTDAETTYTMQTQAPTSSLLYMNSGGIGNPSEDIICYAFHSVKGFSKVGSYVGNGSSDGTFVYTGFKPAWIMIKQSSASGEHWFMYDVKRSPFNVTDDALLANQTSAEFTGGGNNDFDILSNGFKLRATDARQNGSGSTYIYMCFAENPLVGTNNIPATAR